MKVICKAILDKKCGVEFKTYKGCKHQYPHTYTHSCNKTGCYLSKSPVMCVEYINFELPEDLFE